MTSISGHLRKAICFPLKNKKLMLQVFMLGFVPFLILVLLHSLTATPLMAKVEDSYENSLSDRQDLISLVLIEIPFAFAFCLLLLFASAITVFATVSTHQGASIGLKEMLLHMKSSWKKIVVSGLYVSFLITFFIGVTVIITRLTAVMGIVAAITYPYVASICTLVVVISSVEDEFQGKKALRRAGEIVIKQECYFLMVMLTLLSIPVYVLFYVTSTDDDDENGSITQFGFLLVATLLFCLSICFKDLVYTLYYLEYKQSNIENVKELENRYQSVPTEVNTDC